MGTKEAQVGLQIEKVMIALQEHQISRSMSRARSPPQFQALALRILLGGPSAKSTKETLKSNVDSSPPKPSRRSFDNLDLFDLLLSHALS